MTTAPDQATANASTASPSGPAAELEQVVVRNRRRSVLETVKEVPQSVSIVAGEELEKQQVSNFRDVIKRIGNIKWAGSSTNPTTTALSLRGVGYLGSGGALGFDASINTTVDNVPFILSNMAVFNSYYDIESVDVARGPQGASGGYSASLGKITFVTKAPSFVPEAEASITYGQNNTLFTRGVIGGPVIDDLLAWRGTFFREQADGTVTNRYYSSQTRGGNEVAYGNTDRTYGRVQFLLTPASGFKARVSLDATPNSKEYGISSNGGIFPTAVPDFYDYTDPLTGQPARVNQANQDTGKLARRWFNQNANYTYGGNYLRESNRSEHYPIANDTRGASAQLSWILPGHELTSITAWRDYHFDFGSPNFSNPTAFDILRGPSSGLGYFQQKTQEIRLTSDKGKVIDYQTGLFLARVKKSSGGDGRGNKFGSDAGAYYASEAQYNRLDADGNGRYLMANSLEGLGYNSYAEKKDTSIALYGSLNWHITEQLNTNTGLRVAYEERRNDVNVNRIYNQGYASELNPVSVNNVALGGFATTAAGLLNTTDPTQVALANYTAQKYFGVSQYSNLTAAQARQVADAKAIRAARLSGLYGETAAEPVSKVLYAANISPSYKFSDTQTGYLSWQHGEKAGISQIVGATRDGGVSVPVKPEKNDSFEIGLRSAYLDGALVVNTTFFYQTIRNYISNLYFYDEAQTRANNDGLLYYTSGVGNVPKVRSKGVELDVAYTQRNTSLRFSGAYNDARFVEFKNAAKPLELGGSGTPYYDISGRRLPGVGAFSFNVFAEQSWPVLQGKKVFANANYNYTSSYLTDPSLSRYSKVDGYGLTDLSVGFGSQKRDFEISLLVKNAFNVDYGYQPVWNLYIPSTPRWAGITVSSKFY
ncbi:MAG TPA: TonB-dependent receptor [Candidatus Aquabacterium excrementipullorum]|nr:TonB-dependent receptor [Candidatus Aquabacterium excrementipullorum]